MQEETRSSGRGVLEGAFELLDVLARCEDGAGLSMLARATALPKPTVHRLLQQLVAQGAVQCHGPSYFIGSRLAQLGRS